MSFIENINCHNYSELCFNTCRNRVLRMNLMIHCECVSRTALLLEYHRMNVVPCKQQCITCCQGRIRYRTILHILYYTIFLGFID